MLLRRSLATAAAAQQAKSNPMIEPSQQKTSRLPSGLTVSSVDLQGPVSQLIFAFRSGSRYQQPDEGGVAHLLRNCIGTDSDNYLGLKLLWQTGQTGASLTSKLSKELLCVQMSVARTQAPVALSILGEIVQPAVKPWDVLSVSEEMGVDLKHQSAKDIVIENLHRAAYRNGSLAQPLLAAPYQLGNDRNVGHKRLGAFIQSRWRSGETALVGINVDHSLLLEYASEQSPVLEGNASAADPSPFLGGDVRQAGPGGLAHVAVVGQGAKFIDETGVAVQAVLCALIGQNGQFTPYDGIAQPAVVQSAVFKAANHNPFTFCPVNISHSDQGLVGFYLAAEGSKVHPYVKAAVQALRELASKPVDAETLQIAKRWVEVRALIQTESTEQLAVNQAVEVLAKGMAQAPEEFVQLVQQVSAGDVQKAATQMCSKLALSAYGKIHQVPYIDEM